MAQAWGGWSQGKGQRAQSHRCPSLQPLHCPIAPGTGRSGTHGWRLLCSVDGRPGCRLAQACALHGHHRLGVQEAPTRPASATSGPFHGQPRRGTENPLAHPGDGVGCASTSTHSCGTGAGLRVHVTLMGKPQAGRAPHPHVLCPRPPRAGPPAVSVAGSAFRGQDARHLSTGPGSACTFSEENAGQPIAKRLLGQVTSWQRLSESPCCVLGARHRRDLQKRSISRAGSRLSF